MDPFLCKVAARPIDGRYVLTKRIGQGGFGSVYLEAQDLSEGREVALKLEHHSIDPSLLEDEARRYSEFRDSPGFPKVYWYGEHDDFRVMAFELLGPSLEDLFAYCDYQFSLATTLMIADEVLARLEVLHSKAVIHRDIKPQNFLLGCGEAGNMLYMTDFGLVHEYIRTRPDVEGTEPPRARLIGTARFASVRGHQGCDQIPQDDLESLGYMLIYFMRGRLPWQGMDAMGKAERERAIMDKKMTISAEQLCEGLPVEFAQYMQEIKRPTSEIHQNYQQLRENFRRLAGERHIIYDRQFDWTIGLFLQDKQSREGRQGRQGRQGKQGRHGKQNSKAAG